MNLPRSGDPSGDQTDLPPPADMPASADTTSAQPAPATAVTDTADADEDGDVTDEDLDTEGVIDVGPTTAGWGGLMVTLGLGLMALEVLYMFFVLAHDLSARRR